MAELADAADSKSAGLRPLGVRLPLPAPIKSMVLRIKASSDTFFYAQTIPKPKLDRCEALAGTATKSDNGRGRDMQHDPRFASVSQSWLCGQESVNQGQTGGSKC